MTVRAIESLGIVWAHKWLDVGGDYRHKAAPPQGNGEASTTCLEWGDSKRRAGQRNRAGVVPSRRDRNASSGVSFQASIGSC